MITDMCQVRPKKTFSIIQRPMELLDVEWLKQEDFTDAVTRTLLFNSFMKSSRHCHRDQCPLHLLLREFSPHPGYSLWVDRCYLACTHDMTWTMVSIWWMLWFLTHKCSQIKQPRWLLPLLKTWHVPVLTSTEEMKTFILNVTPSWQRGCTDFPWCAFLHPHLCG